MAYELIEQGGSAVLSYTLEPGQKIDQDALAMLANNDIVNIVTPCYSQFDDACLLEYDVTGCTTASNYFESYVFPRPYVLAMLQGLADALADAQDHLIALGQFEFSLDRVFVNEDAAPQLICLPVVGRAERLSERDFLMVALQSMDADPEDDASYQVDLYDYLKDDSSFSLDSFRTLLGSITLQGKVPNIGGAHLSVAPPAEPQQQSRQSGAKEISQGRQQNSSLPEISPAVEPVSSFGQQAGGSPLAFQGMTVPPASGGAVGPAPVWVPPQADDGKKKGKGLFGGIFGKDKDKDKPQKEKKAKKEKEPKPSKDPQAKKGKLFRGKHKDDKDKFSIPFGPIQDKPSDDVLLPSPENSPFFTGGNGAEPAPAPVPAPQPLRETPVKGQRGDVDPDPGRASGDSSGLCDDNDSDDFGHTVVKSAAGPKKKRTQGGDVVVKKEPLPRGEAKGAPTPQPKPKEILPSAQVKRVSTGETGLIDKSTYRLGRKRCDVDFYLPNDLNISRCHAIITFDGKDFAIADNGSSNHTYVNGVKLKVGEKRPLENGDKFSLGHEKFVFLRA